MLEKLIILGFIYGAVIAFIKIIKIIIWNIQNPPPTSLLIFLVLSFLFIWKDLTKE